MAEEPLPRLDPADAIAFFRAKGWQIGFDWRDVWQEEHARAFTVAKAMTRDLLEDIREEVDKALSEGLTLKQFSDTLRPKLQAKGWWGRKYMTDPDTGESRVVQLGSPARLRTIFQTNLRTSYMAGKWQRIERGKKTLPFLRYVSVMDGRERPEHHDWHDTILPVDDPWWDTHFPPCGWNCRCDTQPLNQRLMDRRGWQVSEPRRFPERDYVNRRTGEVTRVERGIDPGWSYNVGKAPLDGLTPAPRLKDGGELQATLSQASYEHLRGFFEAFGMQTREAALKGRVWVDGAGWPMPVSAGLLRMPDGELVRLSAVQARELARAAQVLLDPDSIGWIWIAGDDGTPMLVRRYVSPIGAVDIGRSFWRWQIGARRAVKTGSLVWTREEGALAAYDPHQPRHGKGSRDGGRFRSTGRGDARASITGDLGFFRTALLGSVSVRAADTAEQSGVDIRGRGVKLEHSAARHILKRHGPGGEKGKRHRPVTPDEVMNAHTLIDRAHSIRPASEKRRGLDRIVARVTASDGARLTIVADRSSKNLLIVTMHARKR